MYIFVERLLNSPYGRLLRAMRENESVVEAMGKSVMILRIKTAAIGSSIAAIAGALFSLYSVNVIATSFSRLSGPSIRSSWFCLEERETTGVWS